MADSHALNALPALSASEPLDRPESVARSDGAVLESESSARTRFLEDAATKEGEDRQVAEQLISADDVIVHERCPLCLRTREYMPERYEYVRYQNTERLVCVECEREIRNRLRPTWQIVGTRVFPRSTID